MDIISKAKPEYKNIKNLLLTALMPVGNTMYIYGGGWNLDDTGAGIDTRSIGLSPMWRDFYKKQDSTYNFRDYNHKIFPSVVHLGLDCSGYVGWVLYNVMNRRDMCYGFVDSAKKIASNLEKLGYGKLEERDKITNYIAGDIFSSSCNDCSHVFICIGKCCDGSLLLLHSSPPGVMLSGTVNINNSQNSIAINLSHIYMKKFYPHWYSRYSNCLNRDYSYLSHYDRFTWDAKLMTDEENYRNLKPDAILEDLFATS